MVDPHWSQIGAATHLGAGQRSSSACVPSGAMYFVMPSGIRSFVHTLFNTNVHLLIKLCGLALLDPNSHVMQSPYFMHRA